MEYLRFNLMHTVWTKRITFKSNLLIKQARYPNLLCLYPGPIPFPVVMIQMKILKGLLQ